MIDLTYLSNSSVLPDESLLWQMPGIIIMKDLNSNYLFGNGKATNLLGFESFDQLYGTNDYEIKCDASRFAASFINEDKQVIGQEKTFNLLYILKYADNNIYTLFGSKKLIKNQSLEKTGVLFQGMIVNDRTIASLSRQLFLYDRKHHQQRTLGCYYINDSPSNIALTNQQTICLFYLLRGKSAKEIAILTKKSNRTIEHYIEALKDRFNCHTRSQLIEKAIDQGFLHYLPREFISY